MLAFTKIDPRENLTQYVWMSLPFPLVGLPCCDFPVYRTLEQGGRLITGCLSDSRSAKGCCVRRREVVGVVRSLSWAKRLMSCRSAAS